MRRPIYGMAIILCLTSVGCRPTSAPSERTQPKEFAAGLTAPSSTPVTPSPTGTGTIPDDTRGCQNRWTGAPAGNIHYLDDHAMVRAGTCVAYVDEHEVMITFTLPREVSEQVVRAALTYEAPTAPTVHFYNEPDRATLEIRFPPGKPSELIAVRLRGSVGQGGTEADLGYQLKRLPNPKVTAEISQDGGPWQPLPRTGGIMGKPLALRLTLIGGPNVEQIKTRIHKGAGKSPVTFEQPDEHTLIARIETPPPKLEIDLHWVEAMHSLRVQQQAIVLHAALPQLVAVDPASGTEHQLGVAPADVEYADISPDKRWAVLASYAPDHSWGDDIWIINLSTGEIKRTGIQVYPLFGPVIWLPNRLVVAQGGTLFTWDLTRGAAEHRSTRAERWQVPSPDNRYIPGYTVDWLREDKDWLAPATLVIYDTYTGQERVYPDLFRYRVPHKGWSPPHPMRWTEDGKSLLVKDGLTGALRVDPASGKITPDDVVAPTLKLADMADPRLPDHRGYQRVMDWGPVKTPDGKTMGDGFPVGYLHDGRFLLIRWEGMGTRRIRQGE